MKELNITVVNQTMTREQAIDTLITNDIFYKSSIEEKTPATEFYIRGLMEGDDIFDIDRYAWINTLFGYDIGKENAEAIDRYLYERDDEILELKHTDRNKVEAIVKELGLNLSFSKWRTSNPKCYEYFN